MKKRLNKFYANQLTEAVEEQLIKQLFEVKFDKEHKERWEHLLTEQYNIPPNQSTIAKVAQPKSRNLPNAVPPLHQSSVFTRFRKWLSVAAIFICLLGLSLLYPMFSSTNTANYMQLVDNYLVEKHFAPPQTRMATQTVSELWARATESYQNGDYEASAQHIQHIVDRGTATTEHFFYLGLSYLYQTQTDYPNAIQSFLQARQLNQHQYEDEISWYLSLAYVKNKELDNAKKELKNIVEKGNWKELEAKKLLESLSE